MNKLVPLLLLSYSVLAQDAAITRPERHEFVISYFRTESGAVLPQARVVYGTYGHLNVQARTWEKHDIGTTPGFNGDVERALRSIKVPFLYMPSETDLYFPIGDARYEMAFMSTVSFTPIPSLWGHTGGAASNPADGKFLNERISAFLSSNQ